MSAATARRVSAALLALTLLAASSVVTPARQGYGLLQGTPVTTGAWSVVDRQDLVIDGELVTLSPDGQWIAGIGSDGAFCVWEVTAGTPTCDESTGQAIDARSIAWAPDNTAVAYTGDALMRYEDTDILVFELATGTTTNLTDDGYDGPQVVPGDQLPATMPLDVFPAWTPDSQALIFARTDRMLPDQRPTDLMMVARGGGEPAFVHAAHPTLPLSINSSILVLADGTLLFVVASHDLGDDRNGVWRLDPDGEATLLMPGGRDDPFPVPALAHVREAANGTVASGYSRRPLDLFAPYAFEIDIETGNVIPSPSDPARGVQVLAWTYAPDGESAVAFVLDPRDGPRLDVRGPDGTVSPLYTVGPEGYAWYVIPRGVDWATNDTILVPHHDGGGSLLTVTVG